MSQIMTYVDRMRSIRLIQGPDGFPSTSHFPSISIRSEIVWRDSLELSLLRKMDEMFPVPVCNGSQNYAIPWLLTPGDPLPPILHVHGPQSDITSLSQPQFAANEVLNSHPRSHATTPTVMREEVLSEVCRLFLALGWEPENDRMDHCSSECAGRKIAAHGRETLRLLKELIEREREVGRDHEDLVGDPIFLFMRCFDCIYFRSSTSTTCG
jgi:hypothetical protein